MQFIYLDSSYATRSGVAGTGFITINWSNRAIPGEPGQLLFAAVKPRQSGGLGKAKERKYYRYVNGRIWGEVIEQAILLTTPIDSEQLQADGLLEKKGRWWKVLKPLADLPKHVIAQVRELQIETPSCIKGCWGRRSGATTSFSTAGRSPSTTSAGPSAWKARWTCSTTWAILGRN